MQEHAGHANAMLREFRKKYDEDEERMNRRIEDKARRQEIRFWKRMAMPDVGEENQSVWSDDDDIVDPVEKERLKEVERKLAEQAMAGMGGDSQQGDDGSVGEDLANEMQLLGGVAMERGGSGMSGISLPSLPSRPTSTGSTGGQTG